MKPEEVQAHVADKLNADATITALGGVLQFSEFDDPDADKALVAARLREFGACIFVLEEETTGIEDKALRGQKGISTVDIMIAESPKVVHAPTGKLLWALVRDIVRKRTDAYEAAPQFLAAGSISAEHGYVLRAMSFAFPVIIP